MNEKGASGLWVIINDLVVRVQDLESQVNEVAKGKGVKWREKDEMIEKMSEEMMKLRLENEELKRTCLKEHEEKMTSYKNEIDTKNQMISKLHDEVDSLKLKMNEIEINRTKLMDGHKKEIARPNLFRDKPPTHLSNPPTHPSHPLTLSLYSQTEGCLPESISKEAHRESRDDEGNDEERTVGIDNAEKAVNGMEMSSKQGEDKHMVYQTFADLISESDLLIKDQNDMIKHLENELDALKIEIRGERWQNGKKLPKMMEEISFENKSITDMMENERKKENNDLKQRLKKMENGLNDMTDLARRSKERMENIGINDENAGSYGYNDILLIDNESDEMVQRHGTLSVSCQWEFASNIQWPEPQNPYFRFLIEQQIKHGRKYGCQDKIMAFSLHNFLLSQKDFSESYGFLCSQIDPSNLNDLVSNLDDLNLSSKFMLPEERFKESKPMENDHAIPYINRLEMLQSKYFGDKDTNLIKEKRIRTQFLNNFCLRGFYLSDLEKLILRQNSSLISMAGNAQEILESKIKANILKYGPRQ